MVCCVDASWWGVGITEKEIGSSRTKALGSINERWRFSKEEEARVMPRSAALQAQADVSHQALQNKSHMACRMIHLSVRVHLFWLLPMALMVGTLFMFLLINPTVTIPPSILVRGLIITFRRPVKSRPPVLRMMTLFP